MSRARFTRALNPQSEQRHGRDLVPIEPGEPVIRHGAEITNETDDSEFRFDAQRLIDSLGDDREPFDAQKLMAEIRTERENAEWLKRYEIAREYLKRPITARELDANYAIKPHTALDGDGNG